MIKFICGKKGSGKTKKMLELANDSIKTAKGQIVFMDKKEISVIDLHRDIRPVNAREFFIKDLKTFSGFINGLIAGNYDIEEIYVDNLLNITGVALNDLENFLDNLKLIEEKYQVNFIFSANCEEEPPQFINNYMVV